MSQKELRRVTVISSCLKGDLACARAAELLDLTVRHVKRLKSRDRQGGEAALAHASRGRPSPRRLPQGMRERILQLARSRSAGFNAVQRNVGKLVRRTTCQHGLGISESRELLYVKSRLSRLTKTSILGSCELGFRTAFKDRIKNGHDQQSDECGKEQAADHCQGQGLLQFGARAQAQRQRKQAEQRGQRGH